MKIKLFFKEGSTNIIDTARDYARCKESINDTCGNLNDYNILVLEDTKTRKDIFKYEVLTSQV